MSKELMQAWIAALESGKYKQGHFSLNKGGCHCALGVLVEVSPDHEFAPGNEEGHLYCRSKQTTEFADCYVDTDLLDPEEQSYVVEWNDGEELSFKGIASRLRERYLS